jgi:DNA-binding transcriptional LysR family regulator
MLPALRDVQCFARVAERHSFSRAAADLGLSQPAISQAIGRLERGLAVRLFERTSRAVAPTPAGRALVPYAEALLDAAAALAAEATRQAMPSIRLAYPPLVGALAARIARRLSRRSPAIDLDLRPAGWTAAGAALQSGEVPVAIMSQPFPTGLPTTARFQVPVTHLAVPAGDPLASRTGSAGSGGRAVATAPIGPDDLRRHRVLLPANRPPGSMWARLAVRFPRHRVAGTDLDDFAGALDLVAAGAGLLPTPRLVAETIRRHDVRFVPFDTAIESRPVGAGVGGRRPPTPRTGLGDLRLTYGLVWRPDAASAEVMAVVSTVQEALRTR